jgi:hypothetical protein
VTLDNTYIRKTWSHTHASRVEVAHKQLPYNAKQAKTIIEIPNELATPCVPSRGQKYG